MKNWSRDELLVQKQRILSEFNFHTVFDFCNDNTQERGKFLKYHSISALRKELGEYLDQFIENYLEEPSFCIESYINSKWYIGFNCFSDGETPYLSCAFRFEVSEMDGAPLDDSTLCV